MLRGLRTDPVVDPEPWHSPEHNYVPASEDLSCENQGSNHGCDADVREEDQWQLGLLIKDAVLAKVEMADLRTARSTVFLSCQVEQQVSRPSKQLVDNAMPQSRNRRVLCQLRKLNHVRLGLGPKVPLDPRLPRVWHKRRVLLNISRRLVVLRVAQSPAVEGYEEERVHDETHGVIELLALRERAMAALVCQDPDAGEYEALHGGVGCPGCEAQVGVGKQRDVGDGEVDEGREVEIVAGHVGHGAEDGGFEAPGGNGIVDLLHSEVRQLEDISVEVDMLALLWAISSSSRSWFLWLRDCHYVVVSMAEEGNIKKCWKKGR